MTRPARAITPVQADEIGHGLQPPPPLMLRRSGKLRISKLEAAQFCLVYLVFHSLLIQPPHFPVELVVSHLHFYTLAL